MMKLLIGFALLAISVALPIDQFSFPGKPNWSDFGLSDDELSENLGGLPLLEPVLLKNPEDILKGFKLELENKDAAPAAESSSSEEDKEEESSSEEADAKEEAAPSEKKSSSSSESSSSSSESSSSEEPAAAAPTEEAAPAKEAEPKEEVDSKVPEAADKPIGGLENFKIPLLPSKDELESPLNKFFKLEAGNREKKHHSKKSHSVFGIRR
ncbi:protein gar2-like [Xenopus laevis]|uniref:Uncharacterized protein n=2 Tax=Xenopus laevis TaxID=8355 RepID=A0A974CB87_XENLA|nr:protein gar2-like [Xenopus laevis]OCT69892.1 hypothetical protein XELAEV_18036817mg [Xenopus laevis]